MRIFFTSFCLFFLMLFVSCFSTKRVINSYPDCSSDDISKMDTCLLGLTLKQAVNKLKVDTSHYYIIQEPIATLRGISFRPNDSTEINLYVQRTLIKNRMDSLEYSRWFLFIIDKPIKVVNWTKDAGVTYKTLHVQEN